MLKSSTYLELTDVFLLKGKEQKLETWENCTTMCNEAEAAFPTFF